MPYTEADTFLALKKLPYADMKRLVDEIVWDRKIDDEAFEQIIVSNGWTLEEYDQRYLLRG